MEKQIVLYEVFGCCGLSEEYGEEHRQCPFYDSENDSEWCSLNEFYIDTPYGIPKNCMLKTYTLCIREAITR